MANKSKRSFFDRARDLGRAIWNGGSTKRKFEGADRGRRTASLPGNRESINKDLAAAGGTLRERSNYLYQNSHYGKRSINGLANGIVGTGIIPTFVTADERAKGAITAIMVKFLETTMCDFNGRLDFYGLTKLVAKTYKREGDCLVLRRRVPPKESITGFQYQVLDMAFLATYINNQQLPSGGYTLSGIQFSKFGKVEGYWLYNRHPSEWWSQPEFYPAEDVIHVLDVDYAGQNLGVSAGATTIIPERDLNEYEDSEQMAKKVQASYALFRTTLDGEVVNEKNYDPDDYDSNDDLEKIEPGSIYHMPPGEQVQGFTPPTAMGAEDYRKAKQRGIAAGYEVTYEMMTGDYSMVNFSSGRMGWIEHGRTIEHAQWITLKPQFLDKAIAWFLEAVPMSLGSDITRVPADIKVTYTTPRREMLDPVKETNAIAKQIRLGMKSLSGAIREMGDDPKQVLKEMIADLKAFKDAGVLAEWSPNFDALIAGMLPGAPPPADGKTKRTMEETMDLLEQILERLPEGK